MTVSAAPPIPEVYSLGQIQVLSEMLVGRPPVPALIEALPPLPRIGAEAMLRANGEGRLGALRAAVPADLADLALVHAATVGAAIPAAAPFPLEVLDPLSREFVEGAAGSVGVPPEMVALPYLAAAAGCLGNRFALALRPGWRALPGLWFGVVARPGAAKTPALSAARRPVDALVRNAHRRWQDDTEQYKRREREWREAPRKERGDPPTAPILERFVGADTTLEALNKTLRHAPGVAFLLDELVSWIGGFDAYRSGKGSDRAAWLGLWSSAPVFVDRAGSEHITIFDPVVPVCGALQPAKLAQLLPEAGADDGFLERFLWSYPETEPSRWTSAETAPGVEEDVTHVLRELRGYAGRVEESTRIPMSHAGLATFVRWYNANAERTAGQTGIVEGTYAKLPAQCAKLLLVLHCLRHWQDPTSAPSAPEVEDAITLVEYFRSHAHRVLGAMGAGGMAPDPAELLAARILLALGRVDGDGWASRSWIQEQLGETKGLDAARERLLGQGRLDVRFARRGPESALREEWRREAVA